MLSLLSSSPAAHSLLVAVDQAHEQANAVIKVDGGKIGVTEDPSALNDGWWLGLKSAVLQQNNSLKKMESCIEL